MKFTVQAFTFFLAIAIFISCTNRESTDYDTELLSVVMISRHGIRSQTQTLDYLNQFTTRPQGFPLWSPPADIPGNLSAKGKENVTKLGAWYRDFYASQGLLPPRGTCPAAGTVFAYANVYERTIQTAQGYLDGLFQDEVTPDCGFQVHYSDKSIDPYFLPLNAGLCKVDSVSDMQILNDSIGGNPDTLKTTYASQLQLMQDVTQSCELSACITTENPNPASCDLLDLPSAAGFTAATGKVELKTLFYMMDQISEQFQLEYAEGMSETDCPSNAGAQCVGWGVIPSGKMYDLMSFRSLYYNLIHGLPSFVQASASNLITQTVGAFDQALSGIKNPDMLAPLESRFTLFAGHDTDSVFAVGRFLDVNLNAEGFVLNDPGPAGALVFELHKIKQSGQYIVRLFYVIASLEHEERRCPCIAESAASSTAPNPIMRQK